MKRLVLFAALALGLTAAESRAAMFTVDMLFDPSATVSGALGVRTSITDPVLGAGEFDAAGFAPAAGVYLGFQDGLTAQFLDSPPRF